MKNIEMTSKEIADITGKRHDNILRDIRDKVLPQSVAFNANSSALIFELAKTSYIDEQGKNRPQYTLNKWAVNALMSYYSLEHAMNVMKYVYELEQTLETVKDIAWEAIEGRNYIGQNLGLKLAGIKHPTLLMRFAKESSSASKELFQSGYIVRKSINRHGDTQWRITQEGFEWLCMNRDRCNNFVERKNQARKPL